MLFFQHLKRTVLGTTIKLLSTTKLSKVKNNQVVILCVGECANDQGKLVQAIRIKHSQGTATVSIPRPIFSGSFSQPVREIHVQKFTIPKSTNYFIGLLFLQYEFWICVHADTMLMLMVDISAHITFEWSLYNFQYLFVINELQPLRPPYLSDLNDTSLTFTVIWNRGALTNY